MISGLKPYRAMKDSGVEWLGEMPEHWDVRRSRRVFAPRKELARPNDIQLSATQAYGVIAQDEYERRIGRRIVKIVRHLEKRRHVEVDDFVISMRSFQGGLERAWVSGCIRSSYVVLRPVMAVDVGFFSYLFKSRGYIGALQSTADFIRDGQDLNFDNFCRVDLPVPPLREQAAIVRYLDHVDRRVRRLVRAKRKLIALLTEQKQAIIHRAVTRGLDTDVPLKDSGIEWLGEVPEHWKVVRVKSLSLVKRGASPRPIADPKYFDDAGEYAWVRIADVSASTRYLEATTQRLSALGDSLSVRLNPGALFLSIAGSVGKPIITKIKCCIHDGFVYFPQFRGNAEFLCRAFSCGAPFGRLGKLGTQLNLNTDTVGGIRLGWPPNREQAAIVAYLDEATASSDRAIAFASREVTLLHEYRTRLIADVVTGKLDAREAAAGLPHEVEESELDEIESADDTDEADAGDIDKVREEAEV